jgi:hypothetical protein
MCDGRYDDAFANRRTDYDMRSEDARDLANLDSYEAYLDRMEMVFAGCRRVLRPGRYMAVIVRNAYQQGEYLFTHADLARRARAAGLVPKGEKVWYQAGSRLRPYGYPYSYVPNIAHQHIVILHRPAEGRESRVQRSQIREQRSAGDGGTRREGDAETGRHGESSLPPERSPSPRRSSPSPPGRGVDRPERGHARGHLHGSPG